MYILRKVFYVKKKKQSRWTLPINQNSRLSSDHPAVPVIVDCNRTTHQDARVSMGHDSRSNNSGKIRPLGVKDCSFKDLKRTTLSNLDIGFESLLFLQRISRQQLQETIYCALIQVSNDYLWTKTSIERAFRRFPQTPTNDEKRIFRDVVIQLFKYVTKSLIMWLVQVGNRCTVSSRIASEFTRVLEVVAKSVQNVAHHPFLHVPEPTVVRPSILDLLKTALRFQHSYSHTQLPAPHSDFVVTMRNIRKEISQRRNTIKSSVWFMQTLPKMTDHDNNEWTLHAMGLASTATSLPKSFSFDTSSCEDSRRSSEVDKSKISNPATAFYHEIMTPYPVRHSVDIDRNALYPVRHSVDVAKDATYPVRHSMDIDRDVHTVLNTTLTNFAELVQRRFSLPRDVPQVHLNYQGYFDSASAI